MNCMATLDALAAASVPVDGLVVDDESEGAGVGAGERQQLRSSAKRHRRRRRSRAVRRRLRWPPSGAGIHGDLVQTWLVWGASALKQVPWTPTELWWPTGAAF
jgi:hypothetical protein